MNTQTAFVTTTSVSPQIFEMQHFHDKLSDCFKIWYSSSVHTYKQIVNDKINTLTAFVTPFYASPLFFEMQYLHD